MAAKFIPGFSTVAPPLAGTMKLGFGRFLFFSAVGALLWAGVSIAAGAFSAPKSSGCWGGSKTWAAARCL